MSTDTAVPAPFDPAKETLHARLYCRNPDDPSALCLWYWCDHRWDLAIPRIERLLGTAGPVLAVFDGERSSYPHRTLPYCNPSPTQHG